MAGVTDLPFRRLVRYVLGDLAPEVKLSTEMISGRGLIEQGQARRMRLHSEEVGSVVIQLFGHEPAYLARAAIEAERAGAASIDINMGCPVPKIVKSKDGAALLKEPELAMSIVQEVLAAVKIPVSVKMRLGWAADSCNALDLAKRFQEMGLSSITVHGRTRAQLYSGQADWLAIREIRAGLEMPVYANGDINQAEDALQALEVTGCEGVAIARAAIGNPWILRQAVLALLGLSPEALPSSWERISVAREHLRLACEEEGDKAIPPMRRHFPRYFSGFAGAKVLREALNGASTFAEVNAIFDKMEERIAVEEKLSC